MTAASNVLNQCVYTPATSVHRQDGAELYYLHSEGGYLRVCVHHVVDLVIEAITFGLQRAVFSVTDYSIQNKVSK